MLLLLYFILIMVGQLLQCEVSRHGHGSTLTLQKLAEIWFNRRWKWHWQTHQSRSL